MQNAIKYYEGNNPFFDDLEKNTNVTFRNAMNKDCKDVGITGLMGAAANVLLKS